jgi:hypothetical protein
MERAEAARAALERRLAQTKATPEQAAKAREQLEQRIANRSGGGEPEPPAPPSRPARSGRKRSGGR